VAVFLKTQGAGFSFSAVQDIAVQLLLPFIAGQMVQPLIGGWLRKHRTLTSIADRGSILLVVYAAFSKGMVAGIWTQMGWASIGLIILVSFLLLAVVLGTTTYVSRWLGFSKEDEIAIVFCGSKKSMASGIPMANILFAPEAVGLIVLPLMLFHQAQLFACAILAQRYAQRPDDPEQAIPSASRPETAPDSQPLSGITTLPE
jgi:sodium/bile acid cotransporter 7